MRTHNSGCSLRARAAARLGIAMLMAMMMSAASTVVAASYNVGPVQLTPDLSSGFGFDPDQPVFDAVEGAGLGVIGNDSFYANVNALGTNPYTPGDGNRKYTGFRFTAAAIGMSGLKLGDITSILYDTKIDGTSDQDWRLQIYTAPQTTGWYGTRVNFNAPTASVHDWATSDSTSLGVSYLRDGATGAETYSGLPAALAAAADEEILFISISGGANTPAATVYSYLDNIQINATGFTSATINAVPEPASLSLIGLGTLALLRRRRRA